MVFEKPAGLYMVSSGTTPRSSRSWHDNSSGSCATEPVLVPLERVETFRAPEGRHCGLLVPVHVAMTASISDIIQLNYRQAAGVEPEMIDMPRTAEMLDLLGGSYVECRTARLGSSIAEAEWAGHVSTRADDDEKRET